MVIQIIVNNIFSIYLYVIIYEKSNMSKDTMYSMEEMDVIMSKFIEKSADELIVDLKKNWAKQEEEQHV